MKGTLFERDLTTMTPPEAHDAKPILSLRRRLGLTQEELARHVGTTVCAVDQWEHGYTRPTEAERALLAEFPANRR